MVVPNTTLDMDCDPDCRNCSNCARLGDRGFLCRGDRSGGDSDRGGDGALVSSCCDELAVDIVAFVAVAVVFVVVVVAATAAVEVAGVTLLVMAPGE